MSSRIGQLCDAVVTALNGHTFRIPLQAKRAYLPRLDIASLKALTVRVAPRVSDEQLVSRGNSRIDITVDIGVARNVDPDDFARVDELVELVEQIMDFMRQRSFDSPAAAWISQRNDPVVSPKHLNEDHAFLSLISINYRLFV